MKPLLLASALLFSVASSALATGWEELPPLPEPNGGFFAGCLDGKIIIGGGNNWEGGTKHWLDKLWAFDPQTQQWSATGRLAKPLAYAVATEHQGQLIIAGGFDGSAASTAILSLSAAGQCRELGQLLTATTLASGGLVGGQLIVIGGSSDPANIEAMTSLTQGYDLSSQRSRVLAKPGAIGFGTAASAVIGSRLYVFGGVRFDAKEAVANLDQALTYDSTTQAWSPLPSLPVAIRGADAIALDDQRIYIAGGFDADFSAKAWIYDITTQRYSPALALPLPNTTKLLRCGDSLYCLGGEPAKKMRTARCWRVMLAEVK